MDEAAFLRVSVPVCGIEAIAATQPKQAGGRPASYAAQMRAGGAGGLRSYHRARPNRSPRAAPALADQRAAPFDKTLAINYTPSFG
jgi:hypothetical protein